MRLTVKESDHQVGLTIYQQRPNRGDRFVVDGAWLRRTAVTMIAAGDIADCDSEGDEATAVVVARNPGVVQTLGDNAYGDGTRVEGTEAPFTDCYEPSWGAFKERTYPALGNHEYGASDAAGYFAYFGSEFGDSSTGYYSYGLGAWHVVVLNSNCGFVSCAAGQTQEQWLRADLAANPAACTLAVWHHPRFSSGPHAPAEGVAMQPFWQALVDYDADLVLVGHDHNYQRFARQLADGTADPAGVREFVVGTGGDVTSARPAPIANSERQGFELGVLRLRLAPTRYDWRFVSMAGTSFTDSGSTACH